MTTPPQGNAPGAAAALRPLRLLLIEDCEEDAVLLLRALRQGGYEPQCDRVETADGLQAALQRRAWDLVISDYALPHFSALAALELVQRSGQDLPFLIVSGAIGEDVAVAAMKAGAHDYLMKDNLARLAGTVDRELREAAVRREHRSAEEARREETAMSAALAHVSRELISLLDTPRILDRLCHLTTEVLDCDCSHTLLWQKDAWTPISSYGHPPDQWEAMRLLAIPAALFAPMRTQLESEELVQTVMTDTPRPIVSPLAERFDLAVLLYMPLRRGAQIIGLQTACYRDPGRRFDARQQRVAKGIAHLASLALENARLVEQLQQVNRLKSEFVANISHELRTPLNRIIGYNDLLLEGVYEPLTPSQIAILRHADNSAHELLDLINTTLDLSRLEAGRLPLALEDVGLADLVTELETEPGACVRKSGVAFASELSAELPRLHTDRAKLKLILKNLIDNALKFTEVGRVTVAAQPRDGGVEIRVTDTGIGIAPEIVPIIFEPFRQADGSSTRRYGGLGLGLYVARRMLEALGGTITVDTAPGQGSTFRVWVPITSSSSASAERLPRQSI